MRRALAILMLLTAASAAMAQGKIAWTENFDEGLKKAKDSNKPIMLYFGSPD